MIKNWRITGDLHREFSRLYHLEDSIGIPDETAIIILGDAGLNYTANCEDIVYKSRLNALGFRFYLVRGNHEMRPEDVPTMEIAYDVELFQNVYYEPAFPNIRYLIDGRVYTIDGLQTLVLGGAYSVDKEYRIMMKRKWFANEQLSEEERNAIFENISRVFAPTGIDVILSHTCPLSYEPVDLFLSYVDQNKVDKSMEMWLDEIEKILNYKHWWFGHFHRNRRINDKMTMLFEAFCDFKTTEYIHSTAF